VLSFVQPPEHTHANYLTSTSASEDTEIHSAGQDPVVKDDPR
jgi:hypothetical protein